MLLIQVIPLTRMKQVRKFISCIVLLCCSATISSQDFDTYFANQTLRIDYIFSGNVDHQEISVDQLSRFPGWYGKKKRLAEAPVEGNGQIIVRTHTTQEVIYRHPFSTLFQEWLAYDEAKTTRKAFENVFLIPMPKDTVDVTVILKNNKRETMAEFTHTVAPDDILIRSIGGKDTTPYEIIQAAEDTTRCIHIAYVSEGYTEEEMGIFLKDVKVANDAIFEHEPFRSTRNRFQIIAVKAASAESGTSVPHRNVWKNTVLRSHFDTFYSQRYLTTLHLKELHNLLAGLPYEHIIVLVNTPEYGGGGILNSYNLSMTGHKAFKQVVTHEFGHSFGGLGDEYAYEEEQIPMYPADVEPWEPNLTTLQDFNGKWEHLIKKGTPTPTPLSKDPKTIVKRVGLFEGAGYSLKGVYRACQDCRMRSNDVKEFCPACQLGLTRMIDFYTR